MLCIIALSWLFSGASFLLLVGGLKQWFCKNITVKEGLIAKSVTKKNNRRVDCAEAIKKTVQTKRYEWWGFFVAGDCLAELPVINFQAKPDRFQ
jgi:hypothetical protein